MAKIIVSRVIKAPVHRVWEALDDFGGIYKFNPNLKRSYITGDSENNKGMGCSRQCDMKDGKNWVRERIIDYKPNKSMRLNIYDGTMPFKSAWADMYLKEEKEGTKFTLVMNFVPKFGPLGAIMAIIMKPVMKKMLDKLMIGCEEYVIDGKLANPVVIPPATVPIVE